MHGCSIFAAKTSSIRTSPKTQIRKPQAATPLLNTTQAATQDSLFNNQDSSTLPRPRYSYTQYTHPAPCCIPLVQYFVITSLRSDNSIVNTNVRLPVHPRDNPQCSCTSPLSAQWIGLFARRSRGATIQIFGRTKP